MGESVISEYVSIESNFSSPYKQENSTIENIGPINFNKNINKAITQLSRQLPNNPIIIAEVSELISTQTMR